MDSIEADKCECNMTDSSRENTSNGVARLLVKDISFAPHSGINFHCQDPRETKYIIECNGDDGNNFASSPFSVALMVFCLFLIFLIIYYYTKWKNGKEATKDMRRQYERQIEELKKQDGNTAEVIVT